MEGWEGAKDHRRSSKSRGVHVEAKNLVDCCKSSWRPFHGVIGRRQPIHVLVPWGRAREKDLNEDSSQIHISESFCESWSRPRRSEEEHYARADKWRAKMCKTIRYPCQNVKCRGLVRGKDVAQICAVDYIFEGWEDSDPNRWSVLA